MSKKKKLSEEEQEKLNSSPDEAAKHELEKKQRELKKKLREQRKLEEEKKQQEIFSKLEGGSAKDFQSKKEKEAIEFPDGRITSLEELNEISKMLLSAAKDYEKTFPPKYYDEMRRLTGFKKDSNNPHHKPFIFSIYTIKFAYGRYNLKELIRTLQERNPYLAGLNIRNYKHFQFFSESDTERLKEFIQDMITVMESCTKWYQFENKYSKMYNLAFPDDLFDPQ
jgi:hypothetical protein